MARFFTSRGDPNNRESKSCDAAAYATPLWAIALACASPSAGAWTHGIPSNSKSRFDCSTISSVSREVCIAFVRAVARSPISTASRHSRSARRLISPRATRVRAFSRGGSPSKTNAGLMLAATTEGRDLIPELEASVVTSRPREARSVLPFLLGLVLILAALIAIPKASAAPPGGFQPPHSDYGVDTDSDGLFNALVVEVNMSIAQTGDYLISAYLHDASYRLSTGNSTQAHLDPGPNSVLVALDGWRINVSGVDGPYSVELSLYERTYGLSDSSVHTTAAYSHLEFESPPAYLVPPFSDAGVDTNGNGRFDELAVDVNLTVEQTEYYGLYANLRGLDVSTGTPWQSYPPGSYS